MIKLICVKMDETRKTETGFYLDFSVSVVKNSDPIFGGNFEVFLTGEENIVAVNQAIVDAGKAWASANGLTIADKDVWFDAVSRG